MPERDGELRLEGLTKRFGTTTAVDALDLVVPGGSFFALLGPSGCGKTTTLRMVAGLEDPTAGRISLGGEDVTHRRAYQRPVNTVFQNYALFPHLSIHDNVAFGLRRRGVKDVGPQVERMLEMVELPGYGARRPGQLSGGQQQRVALARALINRPRVLLLDEPLGALDLKLRRQMQLELKRIQTEVGITFVHVTHDQEEAMTMADTIAVMNGGRLEQLGSPEELYEHPATTFVANFLGQSNLLRAAVVSTGDTAVLDCNGCPVRVPGASLPAGSRDVWVGVRPEKVSIVRDADGSAGRAGSGPSAAGPAGNELPGTVVDTSFTGVSTQYAVRVPWGQVLAVFAQNVDAQDRARPGDAVRLRWLAHHCFVLDAAQDAHAGETVDGDAPVQAVPASAAAPVAG